MKQINLLPKDQQQEVKSQLFSKKLIIFWIWVGSSLLLMLLLILITRIYLDRTISQTQKKIDDQKALLDSSDYRNLQKEVVSLNKSIKEIENLRANHYEWSGALVELSNLIPADMQLNNIALEAATGKILINGQAKTRESVISFWSSVIKSEYFDKINFPLNNLEKAELPNFTFTFFAKKDKFKAK